MKKILLIMMVSLGLGATTSDVRATDDVGLEARVEYLRNVITGKRLRHRAVRDALTPLFGDEDGRDRFLLNLVALVDRAGIREAHLYRVIVADRELDEVYGYARQELKLCGRWYLWLPRCVNIETRWRRIEDTWMLLPPEQIRLDPEVRQRLRTL